MIKLALTDGNFKWIADQLRCEPEMVIAFSRVECKRPPFDADGFPAILFERHVFWRNADKSKRAGWHRDHPDICGPSPYGRGGYGSYAVQREKFSRAYALDPGAAMEACSWGAFQELGENFADYGYDTVVEFVNEMKNGLLGQCRIFIKSIRHRGLQDDLQTRNYKTIARLYNGAGYEAFDYDGQIEREYHAAKDRNVAWASVASVAPSGGTMQHFVSPVPPRPAQEPQEAAAEPIQGPGPEIPVESPAPAPPQDPNGTVAVTSEPPKEIVQGTIVAKADPEQRIAVVKTPVPGFFQRMFAKITGAITGNAFFLWVEDKAQSIVDLGLPKEFWYALAIMVGVGSLLWLVSELFKAHQKSAQDKEMEALLVRVNSTDTNTAQLISPDEADLYKLKGYKVITT